MIEVVVLYVVLGLTGIYGIKKGAEIYVQADEYDVTRYEACVNAAEKVKECKDLE